MTYTEYVMTKVEKTKSCWLWKGVLTDNGYGQVRMPSSLGGVRRRTTAHRVVYELLVGPIPKNNHLDHLCRNHQCVNPAHLEPVTDKVNILRGVGGAAINSRKTHCKNGHPFDAVHKTGHRIYRACRKCAAAKRRRLRRKSVQIPHKIPQLIDFATKERITNALLYQLSYCGNDDLALQK